jgi:hypothetical protein
MSGLILVYLIVFCSEEGMENLDKQFGEERCSAYVHLFELLLLLENFCKQDQHEPMGLKIMKAGMPYIMDTIKEVGNRNEGCGWKIVKFHLLSHFVDDITRFGSMKNFDSSIGERNHKTEVKNPSKNTQRRKSEFEKQTSDRYFENLLINMAESEISFNKQLSVQEPHESSSIDKFQNIVYDHEEKKLMKRKDKKFSECEWKDSVFQGQLLALCDSLVTSGNVKSPIKFFTQHNRTNYIFRGDPDYRDEPWYDWAYVNWDEDKDPVPAKILLFMDLNDNLETPFEVGGCHVTEKTSYAIAHTFEDSNQIPAHLQSLLVDYGEIMGEKNQSPLLCMFCLDSITAPCVAIPYKIGNNIIDAKEWLILRSKDEWYNIFMNHLQSKINKLKPLLKLESMKITK